MRISKKTDYALRALFTLVEHYGGGPIPIRELARRNDVPKRFLEHILIDIRRSGIIASRRGRDGGYVLIKPPESVSIGEVLRMIDGPIAPLPCLSRKAYRPCDDCRDEAACRIRKVFGDLFSAYLLMLESLTLADLMRDDSILAVGQIEPALQ